MSQFTLQNPRKAQNLKDLGLAEDGVQGKVWIPVSAHTSYNHVATIKLPSLQNAYTHTRETFNLEEKQRAGNGLLSAPLSLPDSRSIGFSAVKPMLFPLHLPYPSISGRSWFFFWMATGKKSLDKHSGLLNGKGRSTTHQKLTMVPVSHHLCSCFQYQHCLSSSLLDINDKNQRHLRKIRTRDQRPKPTK